MKDDLIYELSYQWVASILRHPVSCVEHNINQSYSNLITFWTNFVCILLVETLHVFLFFMNTSDEKMATLKL